MPLPPKCTTGINTHHSCVVSIVSISLLTCTTNTHVHVLSRGVDLLVLLVRLSYVDMNEEAAQLKLLIVRVLQLHRAEASLDAGQRVDGLADEVGITKHVLILNRKPQQGEVGVHDVKLASFIPDRIEPSLLWNGKENGKTEIVVTEPPGNTTGPWKNCHTTRLH